MPLGSNRRTERTATELRPVQRLKIAVFGTLVIFAALGAGEAVYRLLFLDFDGAKDRLPIEICFGLAFAYIGVRIVRRIYQHRVNTSTGISLISDRNHKIRHAVDALVPAPYPANQQAIRVIREEVERIDGVLEEIQPR
jgi:hypothetical protein